MSSYCPDIITATTQAKETLARIETLTHTLMQSGDMSLLEEIETLKKELETEITHTKELLSHAISQTLKEQGNDTIPPISFTPHGFVIEGNIRFTTPSAKDIPVLKALSRIKGYLDAHSATSLDLPQLQEVGGNLWTPYAKSLDLPQLREVKGRLRAPSATSLDLPSIVTIGGNVYYTSKTSSRVRATLKDLKARGIIKGEIKRE